MELGLEEDDGTLDDTKLGCVEDEGINEGDFDEDGARLACKLGLADELGLIL